MLPANAREPLRAAVKRHCVECNGGFYDERRDRFTRPDGDCTVLTCPLWPYYGGVTRWGKEAWKEELVHWTEVQRERQW